MQASCGVISCSGGVGCDVGDWPLWRMALQELRGGHRGAGGCRTLVSTSAGARGAGGCRTLVSTSGGQGAVEH